ncbi:MAG: hypothetical protein JWR62_570, partial [Modestobacter sp.]|nr:hypothetical protein [Modestobacter sp.]
MSDRFPVPRRTAVVGAVALACSVLALILPVGGAGSPPPSDLAQLATAALAAG